MSGIQRENNLWQLVVHENFGCQINILIHTKDSNETRSNKQKPHILLASFFNVAKARKLISREGEEVWFC